jgi:hypothetical protein
MKLSKRDREAVIEALLEKHVEEGWKGALVGGGIGALAGGGPVTAALGAYAGHKYQEWRKKNPDKKILKTGRDYLKKKFGVKSPIRVKKIERASEPVR